MKLEYMEFNIYDNEVSLNVQEAEHEVFKVNVLEFILANLLQEEINPGMNLVFKN